MTERLAEDVAAERGKLRKEVVEDYCNIDTDKVITFLTDKNHKAGAGSLLTKCKRAILRVYEVLHA